MMWHSLWEHTIPLNKTNFVIHCFNALKNPSEKVSPVQLENIIMRERQHKGSVDLENRELWNSGALGDTPLWDILFSFTRPTSTLQRIPKVSRHQELKRSATPLIQSAYGLWSVSRNEGGITGQIVGSSEQHQVHSSPSKPGSFRVKIW